MIDEFVDGFRRCFPVDRWRLTVEGDRFEVVARDARRGRPGRAHTTWAWLVGQLTREFEVRGVGRDALMPLSYARGSEVLHSAVQALDPYLKDGRPYVYRSGFLPQPVVRARFDPAALRQGFLSAFVNASRVHPVASVAAYAEAVREGTEVLIAAGLDRRALHLSGDLAGWVREEVEGMTIRLHADRTEVGDFVFVQSRAHQRQRALDMGFSLERFAWAASGRPWDDLVFGSASGLAPRGELDALRTAVLLVGSGIDPSVSGPGKIAKRALRLWSSTERAVPRRFVAEMHDFWASTGVWLRPVDDLIPRLCAGAGCDRR